MIIDCISDLHGHYPKLEGGDLLIVAGDLTSRDTLEQHSDVLNWIYKQDYKKKIVIAGNHDNFLKNNPNFYSETDIEYLCDSGTEFVIDYPRLEPCTSENEGKIIKRNVLKIWGSPWTKTFEGMNPKCKAFTCDTEEQLAEKWALIPDDIDILITHGPPYGILDKVERHDIIGLSHPASKLYEHVGSKSLRNKTLDGSYFKKFRHHIFGHIHEMGGFRLDLGITKFINCSYVNERYQPINKPVRITL